MPRIRQFRREDLDRVLELANSCAAFDGETSEADLAITSTFPQGFLVAEDGGRVVGFAYSYFREVPIEVLERWKARKVGTLVLMVVDPRSRKKGIGTSLLRATFKALKGAGADMVLLDCPSEATDARKLYEKTGFEVRARSMKKRL